MDIDAKGVSDHLTARLTAEALDEIIEMALSVRVSFSQIQAVFGLRSQEAKRLMRTNLRRGGYIAWREGFGPHQFGAPVLAHVCVDR